MVSVVAFFAATAPVEAVAMCDITFDTDPENTGQINFDGTDYNDGQLLNNKEGGDYQIVAKPAAGYAFTMWETAGDLAVANPNSATTTCTVSDGTGTLRMVQSPLPTVTSVSPNQGIPGQGLNVAITGTNFTGTTVDFGAGITVNSFTVPSATLVAAVITIGAAAAPGPRDVSVTTDAGTGTLPGGFTVAPAPTPPPGSSPPGTTGRATPPPADMTVQYLAVSPQQTYPGQPVTITTNVSNTGGSTGQYAVALMINGQVEETRLVSVGANSALPVKFTVTRDVPGTYTVTIGGQQSSFIILGSGGASTGSPASGGLIAIVIMGVLIVATVVVLTVALRRRA